MGKKSRQAHRLPKRARQSLNVAAAGRRGKALGGLPGVGMAVAFSLGKRFQAGRESERRNRAWAFLF
jgi:hypothetical protein